MKNSKERNKFLIIFLSFFVIYTALWVATISIASEQRMRGVESSMVFPVIDSDSHEYRILSENIFAHHVFKLDLQKDYEMFRTPGYPFFVGLIFSIFNSYFAVTFIQILLTFLTAWLLYNLLKKLFTKNSALVTTILYLCSATVITQSLILMSDTLFVFLFITFLYILFYPRTFLGWHAVVAGILLGLATLVRPIAMFLPLILVPFLFLSRHKEYDIKKISKYAGVFVGVFCITIIPWMMRNYTVGGHATLSSLSAYNLFHYNLPEYVATKERISVSEAREQFESHISQAAKENQRSLRYSSELNAVSRPFLQHHFISYTAFHVFKTIPFFVTSSIESAFHIRNNLFVDDTDIPIIQENLTDLLVRGQIGDLVKVLQDNFFIALEQLVWMGIVISGLYAMVRNYKNPSYWLFMILVLYFALLTGPVSYSRYRLPAEPAMLTLGVIGCIQFLQDCRKKYNEIF